MTCRRTQGPQSRHKSSYRRTAQQPGNLAIHLSAPSLSGQVQSQKTKARGLEAFPAFVDPRSTQDLSTHHHEKDDRLQNEAVLGTITSKNFLTGPFKFNVQVSLPQHDQERLQALFNGLFAGLSLNATASEPNIASPADSLTSDVLLERHRHNLRSSINSRRRSLAPTSSSGFANPPIRDEVQPRKRQLEPESTNGTALATRGSIRKKATSKWLLDGSLRCGNCTDLEEFFHARFGSILQNPCKQVQGRLIEAVVSKKSSQYPYAVTDGDGDGIEPVNKPDFWPEGILWKGADRLDTKGRLTVLTRMFTLPLKDKDECNEILYHHKYCGHGNDKARDDCGRTWRSWKELLETALLKKGKDGEITLNLREKYSDRADALDHESNSIRHWARLQIVEELINIAGQVESYTNGERDRDSFINFSAIPSDTVLTPHKHNFSINGARKATKSSNMTTATDQRQQIREINRNDAENSETEVDSSDDQDAAFFEQSNASQVVLGNSTCPGFPNKLTDTVHQICPPSAATSFGSSSTTIPGFDDIRLRSVGDAASTYTDDSQRKDLAGMHNRGRPDAGCAQPHGSSRRSTIYQTSSVVPQVETVSHHPTAGAHGQHTERQGRSLEGRSPSGSGHRSKSAGPQPTGVPYARCFDRSLGNAAGVVEHDGYQSPSSRYVSEDSVRDWNYGRSWWTDPMNGVRHVVGGPRPVQTHDGAHAATGGMLPGSALPLETQRLYTEQVPHFAQDQQLEQPQFETHSGPRFMADYHNHSHMVVDAAMTSDTSMVPGFEHWIQASGFESFAPQPEMQSSIASSPGFIVAQQDPTTYARLVCPQVHQAQPQQDSATLYAASAVSHQSCAPQQPLSVQYQPQYENNQWEQHAQQQQHHHQEYRQFMPCGQWQSQMPYPDPAHGYPPQPGGFCQSDISGGMPQVLRQH